MGRALAVVLLVLGLTAQMLGRVEASLALLFVYLILKEVQP